jgi:hypothetical protein
MKLPRLAVPSTQGTSENSFWPGFASRRVRKSAVVNTPRRNISSMQGNQLRPVCEEGYGLLEEECPEPIFSSESMGGAGSPGSREFIAQVPPIPIGILELSRRSPLGAPSVASRILIRTPIGQRRERFLCRGFSLYVGELFAFLSR